MKNKINIKDLIKKFKELWKVPRYRAIIKLSLYGIMFFMIFILANIYSEVNNSTNDKEDKSYSEIINNIELKNAEIKYNLKNTLKEYTLEGKIKSNIIDGYINDNEIINKIRIKDNNIYEIKSNEEVISTNYNDINLYLLIPENVINLVEKESAYINKGTEETSYTFNVLNNNINYEIKIIIKEENITEINIKNSEIEYKLTLNFDKKA